METLSLLTRPLALLRYTAELRSVSVQQAVKTNVLGEPSTGMCRAEGGEKRAEAIFFQNLLVSAAVTPLSR